MCGLQGLQQWLAQIAPLGGRINGSDQRMISYEHGKSALQCGLLFAQRSARRREVAQLERVLDAAIGCERLGLGLRVGFCVLEEKVGYLLGSFTQILDWC